MKLQPHQKEKFVQVLRVLGITSAISLAVYYLPNYFLYEQFTAEHSAILLGLIGIKANVWYDSGRVFLNQFEIQRMCTGVQVIAVFLGLVVSVPKVALKKRGISFQTEVEVVIRFEGVEVGTHRLDLIAEGQLVLELKAVETLKDTHFAQVRSYPHPK